MTTVTETLETVMQSVRLRAWDTPFARCLDDIADAVKAGLPPEHLEIVLRGAAQAIREPKRWQKIEEEMRRDIAARNCGKE